MPVDDLPDNVTVYPNYHNTLELARLLASADALIHAGARETFGLVVLEAMASGLPVIGTAFGAVAELVEPGLGVLATDISAASLASAAEALFLLDHHAMGRRARRHIEAQWSWDGVFRQLLAHYAETVTRAAHNVLSPAHASRG
jgi:alpha-1,6-mannosyltransferase